MKNNLVEEDKVNAIIKLGNDIKSLKDILWWIALWLFMILCFK